MISADPGAGQRDHHSIQIPAPEGARPTRLAPHLIRGLIMVSVQRLPARGRLNRNPKHRYHLRFKPFVIQPFMIAPVLPGETMKLAQFQTRAVSDVVKNPLVGWWLEHYLFYVKHRDLDAFNAGSTFQNMVLTQGTSLAAFNRAADVDTYHAGPGIDWTYECLKVVVTEYFRDQGEAWNAAGTTIDSNPIAKLVDETWMDSIVDATVFNEGGSPQSGTETLHELETYLIQYEFMRSQGLTNLTYEDWLRTYGVRVGRAADPHKPELLRYSREWVYPSNTINSSTGAPSSALSWAVAERADKDRFFAEPGFICGYMCARPKIYMSRQTGSAIAMLNDALAWLPAVLRDDPQTSLKEFAAGAAASGSPIQGSTNGYWVDVRDLYIYGDQFVNFALNAGSYSDAAVPTAALVRKYVASADIDAIFTNGGTGSNLVRADGICALTIAGTQLDQT